MKIFIDGKYFNERDAKVSVFDHGLLYGDGVFEGIRAYHGRVFKLKEHIDRLFYSAKAILLKIPMTPRANRCARWSRPAGANKLRDGYIRLVVTRGVGTLGLESDAVAKSRPSSSSPDKIQLYPPELYQRGMDIVTVPTTRNLHSALNPAIKSLNYLNNILAKIEANNARLRGGDHVERRRVRGRMHRRQYVHRQERRAVHAAAVGGRALRHHAADGD